VTDIGAAQGNNNTIAAKTLFIGMKEDIQVIRYLTIENKNTI